MKSSTILQLFIIVMLVFSFTASPVLAQYEPQAGSVDSDGDLILEELPPTGSAGEGVLPGALELSSLPGDGLSTDAVIGVTATPISPAYWAIVKDKNPTFTFTRDAGASQYQIEIWNGHDATFMFKFKGPGTCGATECSLTSPTSLKPLNYSWTRGDYFWRVRSKTGDSWSSFSSYSEFFVISKGFNSTFDVDRKNWLAVHGDWFRVDPGYLKTRGVLGQFASAMQQDFFEDQFVYEVTMKRKVKDTIDLASNRIYFLAGLGVNGDVEDGWDNGYEFIYYDDGAWALQVRNSDNATLIASGGSTFINPYGWNKLTVLTDYPWIEFWINEQYLGYSYIADDAVQYQEGYVGVGWYKGITNSALLVDNARLYYSTDYPYPTTASVDGVRDPAYELKVDPEVVIPVE